MNISLQRFTLFYTASRVPALSHPTEVPELCGLTDKSPQPHSKSTGEPSQNMKGII